MSAPDAAPGTTTQATDHEGTEAHQAQGQIATEDDASLYADEASDFVSIGGQSSTASLTSSVLAYRYENGRRYHAYRAGQYVIPNDEREQDRLDLHHHIHNIILDGELYRAPIPDDVGRILDIGTGTGAWAIDIADKMPQALVTGTDLSPIQPSWVPPNCSFEVDDFTAQWHFSSPFDFIHARGIEGSVSDYATLFSSVLSALRPGGWFEVVEATVGVFCDDDTADQAPNLLEWRDRLMEASEKFGRPMGIAQHYRQWLNDAGFEDIRQEIYKIPFSPWPKDAKLKALGRYQQFLMLESLDAYSFALFTRVLGWSTEQIQLLLAGVRKDLLNRRFHGYGRLYVVYGRKPKL